MTLTQDELAIGKNYHHLNPSTNHIQAKIPVGGFPYEIKKEPFLSDDPGAENLSRYKNPIVEKCLKQLSEVGISDRIYVGKYLYNLHRRGRSRNTLRNNSIALRLFLTYLKESGRTRIKTIVRNDISSFVEHEQDRGLKSATVHKYVAVVVTSNRAYGLAFEASSFSEVRLRNRETIESVKVTASKATVRTSDRLLTFEATGNLWNEHRL